MSDDSPSPRELDWYQAQWEELMDVLSVSDPEVVVRAVRRLQKRVDTLTQQHETLAKAGVDDPEQILPMLENMADQLEELYAERDQRTKPSLDRAELSPKSSESK